MAKKWNVEVTANPSFCGVDAGGTQFAHGKAVIEDKNLAKWFKKHEGYKVTEIKEPVAPKGKKPEGGDDAANAGAQAPADGDKAND